MMKGDTKIIILAMTLLPTTSISAQLQTQESYGWNYVERRVALDPAGMACNITRVYYDGLGRSLQAVSVGGSPRGTDLVDYAEYDACDRIARKWQAVPTKAMGSSPVMLAKFRDLSAEALCDSMGYSETHYEPSPRGLVIKATGSGSAWHQANKGIETHRRANNPNNDSLRCKLYKVHGSRLRLEGTYASGTLMVTETRDEDGHVMMDFQDLLGRTVLKRGFPGQSKMTDTYYIYDGYGELRYVLPPEASARMQDDGGKGWGPEDDCIAKWAYSYNYNAVGLVTVKKLPGREPIEIIYDKGMKPTMEQNGNMRARGEWLMRLHDGFRREVALLKVKGLTRAQVKELCGTVQTAVFTGQGPFGGYEFRAGSNAEEIGGEISLLKVRYFDNYDYLNMLESGDREKYLPAEAGMEGVKQIHSCSTGRLTGVRTYYLETGGTCAAGSELRAIYYDIAGNPVLERSCNHLGGRDDVSIERDYLERPLAVHTRHSNGSSAAIVHSSLTRYTYDDMGRLLAAVLKQDSGPAIVLAENEYDALGRLSATRLGGTTVQIAYTHNIRGWTTAIESTPFSQWLYYEQGSQQPCYNGDVSSMEWRGLEGINAATAMQGHYNYNYDGLDRLVRATYSDVRDSPSWNGGIINSNQRDYSCSYDYDLNGNLTSMERHGVDQCITALPTQVRRHGIIDKLSLDYDGNQLAKVSDQAEALTYAGAMDFKDGADRDTEYAWDANGNMTRDLNKGIAAIEYNELDLPCRVSYTDGHVAEYTWTADGRKLRVIYKLNAAAVAVTGVMRSSAIVSWGNGNDSTIALPAAATLMTRDYCGSYIYLGDTIERVHNDYGYQSGGCYHYYVRDYRGNVRAVVSQNGTLEEVNAYYPYGALIAAGGTTSVQPHKYTSKELDREAGLDFYDFNSRQLDPTLGRFTTQDPLGEQYYSMTLYSYCAGNPIRYIDPTGNWIVGIHGTKVSYDNRTKTWRNATRDIKELGNEMAKTKAGLQVLQAMLSSKHPISLVFDRKNVHAEGNSYLMGRTLSRVIVEKNGKRHFKSVQIIFYMKVINDKNKWGKEYTGLSESEVLGTIGVHEGKHGTDERACSNFYPRTRGGKAVSNAEEKANEKEQQHIEQLRLLKEEEDKEIK